MKRIRKYVVFLMVFALFMQAGLGTSQVEAAKKTTKVKSLSLNFKKKTIQAGTTLKLKATVKPQKAKAKIKWTSSNKKVATVSASGKVKANKKGVAKITAAVKGTKLKKTCKITVKEKASSGQSDLPVSTKAPEDPQVSGPATAGPSAAPATATAGPSTAPATASPSAAPATASPSTAPATASPSAAPATASPTPIVDTKVIATQDDVEAALADAKKDPLITTVKIKTEAVEQIELPEGDYSELKLVIEAPKAEVSNHAVFKDITIRQIAKDTYQEFAEGNVINADCPIGRIIITDRAKAKLNILKEASEITVVVDGSLSGMEVTGKDSTIDISGNSADPIKVEANVKTELKTSHVLDVNALAKITLVMYPGSEDSKVYVDNSELIPEVYGIGSIKVTFGDTGNVQTVIAEYRDDVSGEQQIVTLQGTIVDDDSGEPRKGALVYLLPYTNNFDESTVEENEYRKTASTDVNGKYTFDSIRTGNYIMVVKEPGMVTAIQYLVITSRYGGVFQNETLQLFPQTEDNEPGSITGTLSNSVDGSPIKGLTARLRKGKGNTVGNVLKKTVSDSQGTYTFEGVEPGYYTVEFVDLRTESDGNYISTSMNAIVRSGRTDVVSTALTKSISASQVRFVLTWGDESAGAPADLDSHLTGPKKDSTSRRFHTYYSERTFYDNGVKYADLDHDDTEWEGPETTTIYEAVPGVYDFYIHDYTNRSSRESTEMATSGAKVEIYQGTTLMVTYYVPNKEGTVWHVCSYDSSTGTLKQHNEMYYESDPGSVGNDPKEQELERMQSYLSEFNTMIGGLEENDARTALKEKYTTFEKYLAEVNTSEVSLEEIQAKTNEISKLIDKLNNSLYIRNIYFAEDSNDYAEINNARAEIIIYTLSPSDAQVETAEVGEGARYEVVNNEKGTISGIRIITEEGYAKTYTVTYDVPRYYFSISEVEGDDVRWWTTRTEYDEDDNERYILNVYTKDGSASEFTLSPIYSGKVQTSYGKDSDGVITSVTLSVGDVASRTYQVKYCFDEEQLIPSSISTVSGEEISWDYDWDYDENDNKYYFITVLNETGAAGDITVTTKTEDANVTYTRENDTVTSFTISIGEQSRTYQVNYVFDEKYLIPQSIVSDEVEYWDWEYEYDENYEVQYCISVWTMTGEACDFTVTPETEKAEVSYEKDGDVIQSVTIKIGENTRTYQVRYKQW